MDEYETGEEGFGNTWGSGWGDGMDFGFGIDAKSGGNGFGGGNLYGDGEGSGYETPYTNLERYKFYAFI